MENILAFEASDFRLTLALMKKELVVGAFRADDLYGQDQELLLAIERLLKQHHLTYDELDLIATTQGPGSFTGVRVALATAVGLSLASGKPAVAFNVFKWVAQSYASSHDASTPILVALESKRKDVYCQLFDQSGVVLKEPMTLLPHEVSDYIADARPHCIGSGCSHLNVEQNHSFLLFPDFGMPTAENLCSYAKQQVSMFGVQAFPCEPYYLRMPDVTLKS